MTCDDERKVLPPYSTANGWRRNPATQAESGFARYFTNYQRIRSLNDTSMADWDGFPGVNVMTSWLIL